MTPHPSSQPIKLLYVTGFSITGNKTGVGHRVRSVVQALRSHPAVELTTAEIEFERGALIVMGPGEQPREYQLLPKARPKTPTQRRLSAALNLLFATITFNPTGYTRRHQGTIRASLCQLAADEAFDAVWFYKSSIALYWPKHRARLIADIDDLEARKERQHLRLLPARAWLTPAGAIEVAKRAFLITTWTHIERRLIKRSDLVVACSPEDAAILGPKSVVIPNSIANIPQQQPDTAPSSASDSHKPVVLFVGLMIYPPNSNAAEWLASEIMPLVWHTQPDCQLRIVGPGGREHFSGRILDPRVNALGFVPDLSAEMKAATIFAAPIRYSGGTRLKLVEAAAWGSCIISTAEGARGLPLQPNRDYLAAETATEWSEAILRAIAAPELRHQLGGSARKTFETEMSQEAVERGVSQVVGRLRAL